MVPKKVVTFVWTAILIGFLLGQIGLTPARLGIGGPVLGPIEAIAAAVGIWFLNSWFWKKGYYDWL